MNKFMKIIIAMLGGVNTAFSIIIPIFIAFLIINSYSSTLGTFNMMIILVGGLLSTLYRAVSLWFE